MALFCGQARYKMVSTKNKSEEKDIKLTVFYRKIVFFSSFCGNLINFVHVLLYNKVQIIRIRMENLAMETFVKIAELLEVDINELLRIEKSK